MQYTEKQACARRSNNMCQHGAEAGVSGMLRGPSDYPALMSQQHSWTAFSAEPGLFINFMLTFSWKVQELWGDMDGIQDFFLFSVCHLHQLIKVPLFPAHPSPNYLILPGAQYNFQGVGSASGLTLFASGLTDGRRAQAPAWLLRMRFVFLQLPSAFENVARDPSFKLYTVYSTIAFKHLWPVWDLWTVISDPATIIWAE